MQLYCSNTKLFLDLPSRLSIKIVNYRPRHLQGLKISKKDFRSIMDENEIARLHVKDYSSISPSRCEISQSNQGRLLFVSTGDNF